jgi:hypothetical protein
MDMEHDGENPARDRSRAYKVGASTTLRVWRRPCGGDLYSRAVISPYSRSSSYRFVPNIRIALSGPPFKHCVSLPPTTHPPSFLFPHPHTHPIFSNHELFSRRSRCLLLWQSYRPRGNGPRYSSGTPVLKLSLNYPSKFFDNPYSQQTKRLSSPKPSSRSKFRQTCSLTMDGRISMTYSCATRLQHEPGRPVLVSDKWEI